jgi:hypothetical protein
MEPRSPILVVANDQVIPAQCEGVVTARVDSPLGVEIGLVDPSPVSHPSEGLYMARTVVRGHPEVPVRVLNATRSDQLKKGSPLPQCKSVTLVTPPNVEQPYVRDTSPKLQNMIAAARPKLSDAES